MPAAGPCQGEGTVLHVVLVSKKGSKKNLGTDKPSGVNRHVERRNLVEVLRLDFQNAFDEVPLWKP